MLRLDLAHYLHTQHDAFLSTDFQNIHSVYRHKFSICQEYVQVLYTAYIYAHGHAFEGLLAHCFHAVRVYKHLST